MIISCCLCFLLFFRLTEDCFVVIVPCTALQQLEDSFLVVSCTALQQLEDCFLLFHVLLSNSLRIVSYCVLTY